MSKKIIFASDFHLGVDATLSSLEREKNIVRWISSIQEDMEALYLVGDIFDYWFEYKNTIPKGFTRFLGKLAELRDADIPVYFFTGNHDMWMFDYFEKEFGIPVYYKAIERKLQGKNIFIGHGDGLGPGDKSYKMMKKVFTNPLCNWLFKWLHPDLGVGLAKYLSVENKAISGEEDVKFLGEDKEHLILYCKEVLQQKHYDYFVFGHRHLPMILNLPKQSKYVNTGDWIAYFTYGVLENGVFKLEELFDKK